MGGLRVQRQAFRTLPFESKYKPQEFDEFLAETLEAGGVAERFYELPGEGDIVGLTFMTPDMHRRAIECDLLPLDWDDVEDAKCDFENATGENQEE